MDVCDICYDRVYFKLRRRGWSDVLVRKNDPSSIIGSLLKVKNATWNATWVFIPTKLFRRSFDVPYQRFCFGNSRRVALRNFFSGRHVCFRTGSEKPWLKSTYTHPEWYLQLSSKEVTD